MVPDLIADPKRPYKAIYAFVLACLTAATGIWMDNPWLTGALAVVTALGTFFVPNPMIDPNAPSSSEVADTGV